MYYDIRNPFRSPRIVHVGEFGNEAVTILPGETSVGKFLRDTEVLILRSAGLTVSDYEPWNDPSLISNRPADERPSVFIDGMYGIGDNLHQRGALRELMKTKEVWISTPHWQIYHDLVAQGLHLVFKETRLRAQAKTIERERHLFQPPPLIPGSAWRTKLWYKKPQIDLHGSILASMMAELGFPGVQGDFSLPIPPEWRAKAEAIRAGLATDKPIMIYRPIVRRREWNGESRNPDPGAYTALYEAARAGYFTISIADLMPDQEWIVGGEQPADLKFHAGELDFETMAGLFSIADMGFFNAGFAPVLAQAVGLPSIVVYGGRESFRTTQAAGVHLAPTLGIDPINPCDCHTERHACDKRIDVPRALDRVREFIDRYRVRCAVTGLGDVMPEPGCKGTPATLGACEKCASTLIFATTYVDSGARQALTQQWLELTSALNPGVPLLLVDSASPLPLVGEGWKLLHPDIEYRVFDFGNNVGHLSRNGGRDGWGRAFTKGLQIAIDEGYTHVAHIEGDSLLRLPVAGLVDLMVRARKRVATTPVTGMVRDMPGWVETGLMIFDTEHLRRSRFIAHYDWEHREARPTPEVIVGNLVRPELYLLPIKAVRGDKQQVTHENVLSLGLDWLTHCHTDVWATDRFFEAAMPKGGDAIEVGARNSEQPARPSIVATPAGGGLKLNLGCGTNKLPGWLNHDADVDITKPLPWAQGSADYIFIEHCVEHVSYHQAIGFFEEAYRVLGPGGVLRVVVPSIEEISAKGDQAYFDFTKKWGADGTLKGALKAILFAHGHQQAWTASLMAHSLRYAGFEAVEQVQIGSSAHSALRGLEGHGRVIGDHFNRIESMAFEATKPGKVWPAAPMPILSGKCREKVAVVVGGAECVYTNLGEAKRLCASVDVVPEFFVVNDMITIFDEPCTAITLHPVQANKLPAWLALRRDRGFPAPKEVWAHRLKDGRGIILPGVTHSIEDWGGSVGLFAIVVARKLGFKKILLCGVPMTPEGGHVIRHQLWTGYKGFTRMWEVHQKEIAPYVRSFGGWTAERLGQPSLEFLLDQEKTAA